MSKSKIPSESVTHQEHLVRPQHTNVHNTLFGGEVMAWTDICAATCAMKHCGKPVVTASMDALHFFAPIRMGWVATFDASVNYTSRTSCEIGVRITAVYPITGEIHHTGSAYLTFVALDSKGKPSPIPQISPQSQDEKRRWEEAKIRRKNRLEIKEKMKKK